MSSQLSIRQRVLFPLELGMVSGIATLAIFGLPLAIGILTTGRSIPNDELAKFAANLGRTAGMNFENGFVAGGLVSLFLALTDTGEFVAKRTVRAIRDFRKSADGPG